MQQLLAGKRGLILGVANDRSIGWGIAQAAADAGASLAFTYQGEALERRVRPLAATLGSDFVRPCDVEDETAMDRLFDDIGAEWGGLDFLIHCVAYANKDELKGRYLDTSPGNFQRALHISCYSFTALARRAAPLMSAGGSLVTLTYLGSERVMPNYNVMGVAKAALESSVRYMAADLGPEGIRVNAISAGPMRTLAGSAIADARYVYRFNAEHSPLRRNVTLAEVGGTAVWLLSGLAAGVTGEIIHVDGGYHAIGMPRPDQIAAEG